MADPVLHSDSGHQQKCSQSFSSLMIPGTILAQVLPLAETSVVYVRNYSETNLAVYHGWFHCGWVNPRRVKEMLLGEAQAAGLRPCSSCGHMAVRNETKDITWEGESLGWNQAMRSG